MTKIVLITGITSGIGLETANALVDKEYRVTGLVRDVEKGEKLLSSGDLAEGIPLIECDLANLKSVEKAVWEVRKRCERIDILINNAGGIFTGRSITEDGLEMTFAVNHLGHFALTMGILDILLSSEARIINVSSEAHKYGKLDFEDLNAEKKYSAMKAYGDGKLCNIYFTHELHKRFHSSGLTSFALHPGVVRTNFFAPFKGPLGWLIRLFGFLMISSKKGAQTSIHVATENDISEHSGKYFKNKKVTPVSSVARDENAAARLWELSEKILRDHHFPTPANGK